MNFWKSCSADIAYQTHWLLTMVPNLQGFVAKSPEGQRTPVASLGWSKKHPPTCTESLSSSPVQRLMSCHTGTLLPTATNLLYPKMPENVDQILKLKRQKAKWYHDRSSHILPEIEIGQVIRVAPLQKNSTWKTGTCIEKLSDKSYVVKTDADNHIVDWNQAFLNKSIHLGKTYTTNQE